MATGADIGGCSALLELENGADPKYAGSDKNGQNDGDEVSSGRTRAFLDSVIIPTIINSELD